MILPINCILITPNHLLNVFFIEFISLNVLRRSHLSFPPFRFFFIFSPPHLDFPTQVASPIHELQHFGNIYPCILKTANNHVRRKKTMFLSLTHTKVFFISQKLLSLCRENFFDLFHIIFHLFLI